MIVRLPQPLLQMPPGAAGHGGAVTALPGGDSSTMQEGRPLQPQREHARLHLPPERGRGRKSARSAARPILARELDAGSWRASPIANSAEVA